MPIVRQGKGSSKGFLQKIERLGRMLQVDFISCGMMAQRMARMRHTYQDQTGNLTSSIGFAVSRNGNLLGQAGGTSNGTYQVVKDGHLGVEQAKALVRQENEASNQLQLVVFAGMSYAKYVEAKGYSVLEPARLYVDSELEDSIKDTIKIIANGQG